MGGFNPITAVLGTALRGFNATDDYSRARASYNAQEQQIQNEAALKKQEMALDAEKDAADRRNALKRAMAKQQAIFGGQGIETTDGSGEAVLLGMLKESDEEKAYRDRLDQIKRNALAQDTDAKRSRNLLSLQNNYASARTSGLNTLIGAL